jgi:hypothetical protein
MSQPFSPPSAYATAPVATKTNTLAIVALVLGVLVPIGGIIAGHVALGQTRRTGEGGHGLALAGTILGYIGSAAWIIFWIAFALILIGAGRGELAY